MPEVKLAREAELGSHATIAGNVDAEYSDSVYSAVDHGQADGDVAFSHGLKKECGLIIYALLYALREFFDRNFIRTVHQYAP